MDASRAPSPARLGRDRAAGSGIGATGSGAGTGAGAGQVLVASYSLTAGVNYKATVGLGGNEAAGGNTFVAINGENESHPSAVVALGGHPSIASVDRNLCINGVGGTNKWGGSGGNTPGDETVACLGTSGGVGAGFSGGNGGVGFNLKDDCPGVVQELWVHGGRGGGAGACSNGGSGGNATGGVYKDPETGICDFANCSVMWKGGKG